MVGTASQAVPASRSIPRDDGLNGWIVLTCGLPKIGIEATATDCQREIVSTSLFVLFLPDGSTFNVMAARGFGEDPMRWRVRKRTVTTAVGSYGPARERGGGSFFGSR